MNNINVVRMPAKTRRGSSDAEVAFDFDDAAPGGLWDAGDKSVAGGVNWGDPAESEDKDALSWEDGGQAF